MLIRVLWPNNREREVEIHSRHDLDRFVSWHRVGGNEVEVEPEGDGFRLVVRSK